MMGFIKVMFQILLLGAVGYAGYITYILVGLGWMAIGLFLIICFIAIVLLMEVVK